MHKLLSEKGKRKDKMIAKVTYYGQRLLASNISLGVDLNLEFIETLLIISLYNHTDWNFPSIGYITFTQFILNIKRVNCILAF